MINDGDESPEQTPAKTSKPMITKMQWVPREDEETFAGTREPPDKNKIALHRAIRALQQNRRRTIPFRENVADWDFDGKDWESDGQGGWSPEEFEDFDEAYNQAAASYFDMAHRDNVAIHKIDGEMDIPEKEKTDVSCSMQSDTGANVCATDQLELLHHVVWIKPSKINTAKESAPMTALAIGQLPITANGQLRMVNCYYIPDNAGTIISPTAIVKQYHSEFLGFRQECDTDSELGNLVLLGRGGAENDWILPLMGYNDLWWHRRDDGTVPAHPKHMHISRLSDAAKFELWHQRLLHPGGYAMSNVHLQSTGVPKLRGNSFYRCPSCMSAKTTKQPSRTTNNLGTTCPKADTKNEPSDMDDVDSFLDDLHLPDAKNGQHWHVDLGFVRGSDYQTEDKQGRTVTSVDGKRAYVLIVDRASRYMWSYVSPSKDPPIEAVKVVLEKFKADNPHCTVRTDQDKSLGKNEDFKKMVTKLGFTLELTGSDSSVQNSAAERPHRDLATMMRCMLHSAGLGSKYWSYSLRHAVYIKNRIPHSALKQSPYEKLTKRKPDLSQLRVFGCRVYAKDPGKRKAKLDHHTSQGIFLGFSATPGNVYYKDDDTGNIKLGTHVFFDEAHMTASASRRPLAAEALQRLGYHTNESWIDMTVKQNIHADIRNNLLIEKLTKSATIPTRSTEHSIGFDLHSDSDDITVEPGEIILIPTGIAARCPSGTYMRIAPRSGLTVKKHLHTMAGVIDPDYTGNITVVIHNFGKEQRVIRRDDRIAQLIVERADMPNVELVDCLPGTTRGADGFGSTEKKEGTVRNPSKTTVLPSVKEKDLDIEPLTESDNGVTKPSSDKGPDPAVAPTGDPTLPVQPPIAAAAATIDGQIHTITPEIRQGLHLEMDLPYDIELSSDLFDNRTSREINVKGKHPLLGMRLQMCHNHGLPQLTAMEKSTPGMRLPRWRSELRNGYVTRIDDTPVKTIAEIESLIRKARDDGQTSVKVGFATIYKQAMHPQSGLPQMYIDQMNVIAEHLWNLNHDPEWHDRIVGSIPVVEQMIENEETEKSIHSFARVRGARAFIAAIKKKKSLKQKRKLTRRILMQQEDWNDWKESEWKQLDQYRDQDTFGEPEPPPRNVNKLSLLWTYLIKDDGRKKARCVCNGSKKMRGSVTLAETYASALDQTASRVFWAASAIYNFITIGADAANAFAEAPPPVAPLYVHVDEPYREWYRARYNKEIPPGYVMRVKKALQGHPESARLWALLIDKVIRELNLQPCTHEPNLYYTKNYDGTNKTILFLRQVDDFAIACEDVETADRVIASINAKMTIEVKKLGLITRYNGVDIEQTRHYVKLSNATYINKILANHPWLNDIAFPPTTFPLPMKSDPIYQRKLETATALEPDELTRLEESLGFSYRQGIGEVLFALVTCRPDISFATIKLSQYSTRSAEIHFDAVKDILAYLRDTRDDGIYYWRKTPRMDLPIGKLPEQRRDDNYDHHAVDELRQKHDDILVAAKDSDFAGDVSHRRSVTGVIIKLAGGAVLYKTNFQAILALSSTEAEFTAAADAGKYILYLRTIMEEIGLPQEEATVLYEDNQGSLLMANAQKPTKRTRHMDIKAFAIQQWVERDLLTVKRIDTADNYSDAMTKALGRTLFYRHNDYIMGRILPEYMKDQMSYIRRLRLCIECEHTQSDQNIIML